MSTTKTRREKTGGPGQSPAYVQTSLAAAMTLGLKRGRFHRNARLGCLNLLLTYADGCRGRCSYCGLARNRDVAESDRTFIRVGWPTYPLDEVLERTRAVAGRLKRVCVSMVTHPQALEDAQQVIRRVRNETELPVSALIAPTLVRTADQLQDIQASGADCIGVAVDAATEALFERHRGTGVGGPHRWDRYWRTLERGVDIFGRHKVSVHLIVGLGETEREMVATMQSAWDRGAVPHLFSFFPECGSALEDATQPPIASYRRMQLARHLIETQASRADRMRFWEDGRIADFGVDVEPVIRGGTAFMTSGCPGPDGEVACNRPYGNERPGGILYNYPFRPSPDDLEDVVDQLRAPPESGCETCVGCR